MGSKNTQKSPRLLTRGTLPHNMWCGGWFRGRCDGKQLSKLHQAKLHLLPTNEKKMKEDRTSPGIKRTSSERWQAPSPTPRSHFKIQEQLFILYLEASSKTQKGWSLLCRLFGVYNEALWGILSELNRQSKVIQKVFKKFKTMHTMGKLCMDFIIYFKIWNNVFQDLFLHQNKLVL